MLGSPDGVEGSQMHNVNAKAAVKFRPGSNDKTHPKSGAVQKQNLPQAHLQMIKCFEFKDAHMQMKMNFAESEPLGKCYAPRAGCANSTKC